MAEGLESHADAVAKHYNQLQESGLEERTKSRIFYLRNFNNWIKSMAISDVLTRLRNEKGRDTQIAVLDLCCGKGGDMLKWKKGNIDRLVCADIAGTSVEQCETRYSEMVTRNQQERRPGKMFKAEQFITADCTKVRLKDQYQSLLPQFDITSCQFSFHYCFESLAQAEMMVRNACECLTDGGYFIGTTPNAMELVKRWRACENNSFGNDVYRVTFDREDKTDIPLFGAKYDFHLEGVVDCPEFLVYFPVLEKLAAKHNMKLVYKETFAEFFDEQISEGRGLIGRMQGLEPYPAGDGVDLMGDPDSAYTAPKRKIQELKQHSDQQRPDKEIKVGTLSKDEWEAATIYMVFAFQKVMDTTKEKTQKDTIDKIPLVDKEASGDYVVAKDANVVAKDANVADRQATKRGAETSDSEPSAKMEKTGES